MKNRYCLQIWKLNEKHDTVSDDPYYEKPFMAMKHEVPVKAEILCKDNQPAIDCSGYRVIVKDARANEVHVDDVMFYPLS
jgi:hypothetical protein